MYNINKDLANIFKKMAAIYEFLDDRFRAMAYQRAAHIIEDLPDDIRNKYDLSSLSNLYFITITIYYSCIIFINSNFCASS